MWRLERANGFACFYPLRRFAVVADDDHNHAPLRVIDIVSLVFCAEAITVFSPGVALHLMVTRCLDPRLL
eukprot:1203027-Pleurochrysis_carterae.AAC.1